jgi:hypothetical protein
MEFVSRIGARGKICSVYCRDPDKNLIEFVFHFSEPVLLKLTNDVGYPIM